MRARVCQRLGRGRGGDTPHDHRRTSTALGRRWVFSVSGLVSGLVTAREVRGARRPFGCRQLDLTARSVAVALGLGLLADGAGLFRDELAGLLFDLEPF